MTVARLALVALCAMPSLLVAQQPTPEPGGVVAPPAAADSALPFSRPNGALIRTGASTYRLSLVRQAQTTSLGTRTVEISDSPIGGAPAWLITEHRTGTVVPTNDSLWVARADLTPIRWVASIDRTQLAASFTPDSVFGALQSYRGRASFAAALLPGVLVTPAMAERVVELLPLRSGYRATASLLLLDMGTPRTLPTELFVESEARTHVGSGDVDCWVVVLRAGAIEERLWVSKGSPRVVRTEQGVGGGLLVGEEM